MAIAEVTARFTADASGLLQSLKRVESSIQNAGKNISSLGGKFNKIGDSMHRVGTAMTDRVTKPVLGAGVAAILAGANFEEGMSKVAAVTGATGKDFERLREQAKHLGETTKFSATEAAEGMAFLGQAGFEVQEILDAMPAVLDLAAAGHLDLGRAADIASNIMSAFQMEANEAAHMADVLAKAAASSNTNVEQMGNALSYAGPVANAFGISVEEAAAAISLMSDAGIQGERAGTALRGIFAQLSNVTGSTKKALEKYGLTAEDVNPKTKSLAEIIKTLRDAGVSAADAMELVGVEAGPAMAILLQAGEKELAKFTTMLEESDGTAKQMAKTMSDNTKGSFKEFMSALEGLGIAISDHVLPVITPMLEKLTELVRKFGELSPATQKTIIGFTTLFAAIGPVLKVIGSLASGIGFLISAFSRLGPILASIRPFASSLLTFFATLWSWIVRLVPIFMRLANIVRIAFTVIAGAATGTVGVVVAVISAIVAAAIWLWKNWDKVSKAIANAWNWLKDTAVMVWNWIKDTVVGAFKWMYNHNYYFEALVNFIVAKWNQAKQVSNQVWNAIKSFLSSIWNGIKSLASSIWSAVYNAVASKVNQAQSKVTSAWNKVKSVTSSAWNSVKSVIKSTVSSIGSILSSLASKAYSWGSNFMNMFISGVKSKINGIISTVKNVAASVAKYLGFHSPTDKGPASDSDKWAPNFMKMFTDGIKKNIPNVARTVRMAAAELAALSNLSATPTISVGYSTANISPVSQESAGIDGSVIITGNTFHVRKDSDIREIARELYSLQQKQLRARGRVR